MSLKQFKPKNAGVWKWVLWCGISSFIVVVGWSIYHMTPTLLPIALAMCLAGAAVSLVYTVYMTVNSRTMRRQAWICEGIVVVGLILNVIIHAALSRRFDVATQARQARYVEEERQRVLKKEETDSELALLKEKKALAETEASRLANVAKVTEAQNRQLNMLDRSKRRQLATGDTSQQPASRKQDVSAETTPTPLPTSIGETAAAKTEVLSPEQVQEQSWWWVLLGIFAEVGAIGGTFIGFGRTFILDSNSNGVPDWMEELPPEELLAKHPDHYRRLYGEPPASESEPDPKPRHRPGYVSSPAYAQTPGKDQPSR